MKYSIIIPAKNEAKSLRQLLPKLINILPNTEIVVVNDGSSDDTVEVCKKHKIVIVNHVNSRGNGAAIKSGARKATGDVFIFMDGDGQHRPEDIEGLLERYNEGFDMVVGARGKESQASKARLLGNGLYNRIASYMTGHKIIDLTSGFRVVNAEKFKQFLYLLPNSFSYPTTITMAFLRAGYGVAYEPIVAPQRIGKSHINILKDGARFFLIIFKIGTLYSPMKLFFPASFLFFLTGFFYYIYTFFTDGRFTNMGVLLFSSSIMIFLLGLVSEQITSLFYQNSSRVPDDD